MLHKNNYYHTGKEMEILVDFKIGSQSFKGKTFIPENYYDRLFSIPIQTSTNSMVRRFKKRLNLFPLDNEIVAGRIKGIKSKNLILFHTSELKLKIGE